MEHGLTIVNQTQHSIDVYKSDLSVTALNGDCTFDCKNLEENVHIHVHSRYGSLVIKKRANQYVFTKYGKLTVTTDQSDGRFAIRILEKH